MTPGEGAFAGAGCRLGGLALHDNGEAIFEAPDPGDSAEPYRAALLDVFGRLGMGPGA